MHKTHKKHILETYHPQSGRSMVEMLGSMAIVGVLSVGAIGGYSYAMNKHRTNELIYEATKRAQWVGTQLELNNSAPSLNTFGNDSFGGGRFTGEVLLLENSQIGLAVADLKEAVCDNIKNEIGDNTVIRAIKDSSGTGDITCADDITVTLVFNWDLSTDNTEAINHGSGESVAPSTGITTSTPESQGNDPCNGHGEWDGTACECDFSWSGENCSEQCNGKGTWIVNTQGVNGGFCDCDSGWGGSDCSSQQANIEGCGEHGVWAVNTAKPGGMGCVCDSGWAGDYCSINTSCNGHGYWNDYIGRCNCNIGWTGDNCSVTLPSCEGNSDCEEGYFCKYMAYNSSCSAATGPGECVKISNFRGGSKNGYIWSNAMTWWSAQNFCDAQGKHMVSLSDFNCPYTVDQYKSSSGQRYCCSTAGNSINSGCDGSYSSTIETLRSAGAPISKYSENVYWTNTVLDDSCHAFYIASDNGSIGTYHGRDYEAGIAICR